MSIRKQIEEITIGSDPELFIINTKTNKVKSAIKLIPGTKENPHFIEEFGEGFAIQTDNILAEFNIPPVNDVFNFVDNINKMKEYIRNHVKKIDENYDILCSASQIVPKSELRSKQAREFGCSPDYCIYTGAQNPKPDRKDTEQLRSAGLHLHLGYKNPNIDRSLKLLLYIDAYVGLPSIIIDRDEKRRILYGKAGCFRLCTYGLEYRTLSSYFMKDDEHLKWVFNQLMKAIDAYNNNAILPNNQVIQSTINNNDVNLAKSLCKEFNICNDFLDN